MALFMKEILWMVNLWVKLRMLIYDVFGIGKSSAYGVELFLFCGEGKYSFLFIFVQKLNDFLV